MDIIAIVQWVVGYVTSIFTEGIPGVWNAVWSKPIEVAGLGITEGIMAVDNALLIIVIVSQLEPGLRKYWRYRALVQGAAVRLVLLSGLAFLQYLKVPLPFLAAATGWHLTYASLLFIAGGAYLLYLSVKHIKEHIVGHGKSPEAVPLNKVKWKIWKVNILFSLDSVLTAVGMTQDLYVAKAGVIIACLLLILGAGAMVWLFTKFPNFVDAGLVIVGLVAIKLIFCESVEAHWISSGMLYFLLFGTLADEIVTAVRMSLWRQSHRRYMHFLDAAIVMFIALMLKLGLDAAGYPYIHWDMLIFFSIGTLIDETVSMYREKYRDRSNSVQEALATVPA